MAEMSPEGILNKLAAIRLIVLDVDGVLTDGSLQWDSSGEELKRFHTLDGLGIRLALIAGLQVAWITGRVSQSVANRASELSVSLLFQGVSNKSTVLAELMGRFTLSSNQVAYMGDDLNDLPALALAGVKFAPINAIQEIRAVADFVTERCGGGGAVREMIDAILKARGDYPSAVENYLGELLRDRAAGQ